MKKHNFYFIAECAIILVLLILIGILVKDKQPVTAGKNEKASLVVEVAEDDQSEEVLSEGIVEVTEEILEEPKNDSMAFKESFIKEMEQFGSYYIISVS